MPNRPKSKSGQLSDLLRARVADGDWTTALPHLLHRRLRIPQDLSMVYLSNDPAVERLSPLPDRYDIGDRLLRRLAKAMQGRLSGAPPGFVGAAAASRQGRDARLIPDRFGTPRMISPLRSSAAVRSELSVRPW